MPDRTSVATVLAANGVALPAWVTKGAVLYEVWSLPLGELRITNVSVLSAGPKRAVVGAYESGQNPARLTQLRHSWSIRDRSDQSVWSRACSEPYLCQRRREAVVYLLPDGHPLLAEFQATAGAGTEREPIPHTR